MSTPPWRRLGFLTPDAYEAQQDVWALAALVRDQLGDALAALAERSAEPTWGAALADAARASRALRDALLAETGDDAPVRVGDDELVREFAAAATEVTSSGHAASIVVAGYCVLGELGAVPIRLLEDVAGPYARVMCGRVVSADEHLLLGRLFAILHPDDRELDALRRVVRHLSARLVDVYRAWRQTFHSLGVDAESLLDGARETLRKSHHALGLPFSTADARTFSHG